MRKIYTMVLFALFVTGLYGQKKGHDSQMNVFVDALMKKMTLEEKIGQLNLPSSNFFVTGEAQSTEINLKIREGKVGGLFNINSVERIREVQRVAVEESRLKIPLIIGMDVIHGYETIFPIPLGLSCTWDMQAVETSARIAAVEASANGISWTFSPMVDIARDPRWGRIAEGSGEDPYLGSQIARAMVRGYQGDLSGNSNILSCVKHFALYGAAEGGRDYNTTDMSRVRMFNEYLPPYKAAVEAGAGSIMTSFNEIDGIPATANRWLVTDLLRKQWGFKGFVVTDYTGINEMSDHGLGDLQTVSALALKAGVDMDMVGEGYLTTIKKSIDLGTLKVGDVDAACRRILEAKYKLGLFQDPYKYCDPERAASRTFTSEHRQIAREIARESFVLLRNEGNLLPLKKSGSIALIGPMADDKQNLVGTWAFTGHPEKISSLFKALKESMGNSAVVTTAKGSRFDEEYLLEKRKSMYFPPTAPEEKRSDEELLREALDVASKADIIVAALGESADMSGESSSRSSISLPGPQRRLLEALLKTQKPVVLVLFTGRPLTITWEAAHVPAILNVWHGGTEAAPAIVDVLLGDVSPSGKLTATWPQNEGQIPLYYAHKNTGRPLAEGKWYQKFRSNYMDVTNEPLYPFGFGLSYTTFEYSEVRLSASTLKGAQTLKATVTIRNIGGRDGKEIAQLYIRDLVGSNTRPVKELKGFQKIFLKAGESREVTFTITPEDLKFYNHELQYDWEPGDFQIMIGPDSRKVKMAQVNWTK